MTFQFASPWLLSLLLILPLLAARHYLNRSRSRPAALSHPAAGMIRDLHPAWRASWRPLLTGLRLLAITLITLAMARPQFVQARETIKGEGVQIALAVDISGSMASLDFEPANRLEASKQVISRFIEERPFDQIGLVVFASEAYNLSPLTLDRNMLTRSLEQVELATDLGLEDGTAIGLGLANAAGMLANIEAESKVVVLLTDGVNNSGQIDPLTAAEAAKSLGIKVYTIGAARPGEVPVPIQNLFGGTEIVYQESELDEATLQQIADLTGGRYFRAEDTAGLQAIYDEINALEKSQIEIEVFNQYFELMALFLTPAFALLVLEILLRSTLFRTLP
ncbi:MAG TPA: VWA domain-containing protein [Anaerolineales bacterium]|nr:VWA domain-containing protein [Anaerolineales bacterium]